MKKIIVIGVGAQGSTIAKRMNEHPAISEIICADYDSKAAQELSNSLEKAKALELDARDVNNVIRATEGCDLIVNGLPLKYNLTVMEAALAANASYVDMAGPMESNGQGYPHRTDGSGSQIMPPCPQIFGRNQGHH
jgi:saccharopine dehydrogenase-like NADP-dependent oxidoreductase